MKVLVNATPMAGLLTGIVRYLRNLYLSLASSNLIEVAYFNGRTVSPTMPELANATRSDELADAIDTIVNDTNKRHILIEKGQQHVANFTWRKTAPQTLDIFNMVAN